MQKPQIRFHWIALATCSIALSATSALVGDIFEEIGYNDLIARLGADAPSGAGIGVGQVEAALNGAYGPNQSDSEFDGVFFTPYSGTPGTSSHATTVAKNYYGSVTSVAPGITDVHLWEANSWIGTGFLNYGTSSLPAAPPLGMNVFNLSFVGETSVDAVLLRRADYSSNAYGTLYVVGVNNGSSSTTPPLFAGMYHGISVGLSNGEHGSNDQSTDVGPRMKPEMVAPRDFTSYATPVVAACAALLYETVETDPTLAANSFAKRAQVMKSILMTGATHSPTWTNNPEDSGIDRGVTVRPLDEIYGAGVVQIDRAHQILTGYEQDGSSGSVPEEPNIDGPGWDWEYVSDGESVFYRFELSEPAEEVIFTATWHRQVPSNFTSNILVPDIDLHLWQISDGALIDLVGADSSVFGDGNVRSSSLVDNVEHIYVRDLAAGEYVLEMVRTNSGSASRGAIAWWIPAVAESILGDLNNDGSVNGADLGLMLAIFGTNDPDGDLNNDGTVDGADMGLQLSSWTG